MPRPAGSKNKKESRSERLRVSLSLEQKERLDVVLQREDNMSLQTFIMGTVELFEARHRKIDAELEEFDRLHKELGFNSGQLD